MGARDRDAAGLGGFWKLQEAEEQTLLWSLRKDPPCLHQHLDLTQRNWFHTFSLQHCRRIKLCCC